MPRFALCLLAALAVAAPAAAQSIGQPIPGHGDALAKSRLPAALKQQQAARACPEYGPGFVKVEGSTLCVRAGGQVRAEFGKRSYNSRGSSFGSSARALGYVEARGTTGLGEIRGVFVGGGSVGNLSRDRYEGGFYR
ncbi:hypothetical protein DWF00_05905 [Bosea caraganae]|uniref:Porin n=1 Tax=Bosea caraganae TaxID=2763117 RepID=A0A370L3A1_9HYPH|nr:hypothetical protein [Bosea caraganae]RDJ22897.1 hypothetical protein DWE98_17150 [Bosea caraganae]RDJ28677.1 hypothetical protein DWF00_05905 [Bosea caraganae]